MNPFSRAFQGVVEDYLKLNHKTVFHKTRLTSLSSDNSCTDKENGKIQKQNLAPSEIFMKHSLVSSTINSVLNEEWKKKKKVFLRYS